MISVKNLGFVYKNSKTAALDDINIEIADGDFVGITGTSGAGKTTFTFALNGIIPQKIKGDFYGAVTIDGVDTAEHPAEEFARKVGEVFQDIDSQMVASVVEDETLFGLENFGVPHEEIGERVDRVLRELGIEDLLCLRRSCTMHALYESCPARHVLDEFSETHTVLCRDAFHTGEIFLDVFSDFGILEVGFRRHSRKDTATDILGESVDVIDQLCYIMLADIGEERVYVICPGRSRTAFSRARDRASVYGLGQILSSQRFLSVYDGYAREHPFDPAFLTSI